MKQLLLICAVVALVGCGAAEEKAAKAKADAAKAKAREEAKAAADADELGGKKAVIKALDKMKEELALGNKIR